MPKYLIERDVPGAGSLTGDDLQAVATKSNGVLAELAPRATWLHTYVTDDQMYCVYVAEDEEAVMEHARRGGFPVNRISRVRTVIDPSTADAA